MSLKSPLYKEHVALGASFTNFSGWEMPLHYGSILNEHKAVRSSVGIFDISHMGTIFVSGQGATDWLEAYLANQVSDLQQLQSQYSFLLNASGGVIDDLIIYCLAENVYLIVPNASGVDSVFDFLKQRLPEDSVKLENRSGSMVSIAIQGKSSEALMHAIFSSIKFKELKKNQLAVIEGFVDSIVIARTGYTGSDGFEVFTDRDQGLQLWKSFLNSNLDIDVYPCGLGSRDTLRIEAGYPLYGNELTETLTPIQAGLSLFLKKSLKESLQANLNKDAPKISFYKILEKAPPPRKGYELFYDTKKIGVVTSGSISPTTKKGIGFALVDSNVSLNEADKYTILIRNKKYSLMFTKRGII